MQVDMRHNLREVQRGLSSEARRTVEGATAAGINATLKDVGKNLEKRFRRVLDRPTPFTMKGIKLRFARDRTLRGSVFVMDRQAAYLRRLEDGGTRRPEARAIPVPGANQRLNRYGNLPRKALARGFASPKFFSGSPGAGRPAGLWQRMGTKARPKLRLVALWASDATYSPVLRFYVTARKTADARLQGHVLRRITERLTRGGS